MISVIAYLHSVSILSWKKKHECKNRLRKLAEGSRYPCRYTAPGFEQPGVEVLLHSAIIDVLREAGRLNGVVVGTAEHDKPYDIPYGVRVPRRLDGLLLTGRCISASHEALASCRVMRIAMASGAAAGAATAYALRHNCEVRDVLPAESAPLLFERK